MKTKLILIAASFAALTCSLTAQETVEYFNMDNGNLILGFQATSGTGASLNVLVDLGSPIALRNNGNLGVLGNIGSTLAEVYGDDWHTRSDVWFGVVANLNQNPTSGIGSRAAVDGDPSRTFYLSTAAPTPGTGPLYAAGTFGSNPLGAAGGNLTGLETLLDQIDNGWNLNDPDPLAQGLIKRADGTGVLDQNLPQHNVAWANGWSSQNPTPGAAFQIFTGGIQQNFGSSASEKHVDIQRVLATNTGANPTGVVGGGTYVSTISISSTGQISASKAGAASPFQTWALTFPALDTDAKRLPTADPDGDGLSNLMEFVLNGNPGVSDGGSVSPTLNASGSNFVFSFSRRDDAVAGNTLTFEYGENLGTWTSVPIGATGSTTGSVTVGIVTASNPDVVTVTLPKSVSTTGKLFGRIKVVQTP